MRDVGGLLCVCVWGGGTKGMLLRLSKTVWDLASCAIPLPLPTSLFSYYYDAEYIDKMK